MKDFAARVTDVVGDELTKRLGTADDAVIVVRLAGKRLDLVLGLFGGASVKTFAVPGCLDNDGRVIRRMVRQVMPA